VLKKSSTVLSHDFRVVAVDANNVERVVDYKPDIYHGFLEGELASLWRMIYSRAVKALIF